MPGRTCDPAGRSPGGDPHGPGYGAAVGGLCGPVFARSGLGIKKGVCLSNGVGVIDSDYRGEIAVGLVNLSGEDYTVQPGDRIAQLMVVPVVQPTVTLADELDETDRGSGGLGSTGR